MTDDEILSVFLREDLSEVADDRKALLAAVEQLPAPPRSPCPKSMGLVLHMPVAGVRDGETWRPRR